MIFQLIHILNADIGPTKSFNSCKSSLARYKIRATGNNKRLNKAQARYAVCQVFDIVKLTTLPPLSVDFDRIN